MTPGLNDLWCMGPRVGLFNPKKILLTDKVGSSFGQQDGVDLRFLGHADVPFIGDDTEIGRRVGATVRRDGTEFGVRHDIFKLWRDNHGGVVEYGPGGVGVDLGWRGSVADDLLKLKYTRAGITVGNPFAEIAAPPLM
ncbi:Protein F54E7.6, partial [Aphelenchoides avenae]